MITFPHAKINIGLHVCSRREDGFHEIETVFYPVRWHDAVELIPDPNAGAGADSSHGPVNYSESGLTLDLPLSENLCTRAFALLDSKFDLPVVRMHLHKCIPTGAGLGGGSSDAVQVLMSCNRIFNLGLHPEELHAFAIQLGSDCPFFLTGKPMLARGMGERLRHVDLDLRGWYVLIVKPHQSIGTAWAYARVTPREPTIPLSELVLRPLSSWTGHVTNDFEPVVFDAFPEVGQIRDQLYGMGAVFASMTGSGSAVYGLFEKAVSGKGFFHGMVTWNGTLD